MAEFHYGLGHKPSTVEEAVNIAEVKAVVDQYWNELENLLALDFKKVKQRLKWFDRQYITEYFSSLHLTWIFAIWKHAELANHLQRSVKGRIVLWVDTVKDDSGYIALITEQGASASQVAAARFLDVISRLPSLAGEATEGVLGMHAFAPGW